MPPTILQSSIVKLRQPEPPEGRWAIPLSLMDFATGNEVFTFSTATMGKVQPSAILSMWVDATDIEANKFLVIQLQNQTFQIPGGTQGYLIITSQNNFQMTVSATGTGVASIVLYNYNVYNTGTSVTVNPAGSGSGGSQASGGTPGGGSGGYSGGGNKGNTF
jgi:uncharacterized membrane protein YgcG